MGFLDKAKELVKKVFNKNDSALLKPKQKAATVLGATQFTEAQRLFEEMNIRTLSDFVSFITTPENFADNNTLTLLANKIIAQRENPNESDYKKFLYSEVKGMDGTTNLDLMLCKQPAIAMAITEFVMANMRNLLTLVAKEGKELKQIPHIDVIKDIIIGVKDDIKYQEKLTNQTRFPNYDRTQTFHSGTFEEAVAACPQVALAELNHLVAEEETTHATLDELTKEARTLCEDFQSSYGELKSLHDSISTSQANLTAVTSEATALDEDVTKYTEIWHKKAESVASPENMSIIKDWFTPEQLASENIDIQDVTFTATLDSVKSAIHTFANNENFNFVYQDEKGNYHVATKFSENFKSFRTLNLMKSMLNKSIETSEGTSRLLRSKNRYQLVTARPVDPNKEELAADEYIFLTPKQDEVMKQEYAAIYQSIKQDRVAGDLASAKALVELVKTKVGADKATLEYDYDLVKALHEYILSRANNKQTYQEYKTQSVLMTKLAQGEGLQTLQGYVESEGLRKAVNTLSEVKTKKVENVDTIQTEIDQQILQYSALETYIQEIKKQFDTENPESLSSKILGIVKGRTSVDGEDGARSKLVQSWTSEMETAVIPTIDEDGNFSGEFTENVKPVEKLDNILADYTKAYNEIMSQLAKARDNGYNSHDYKALIEVVNNNLAKIEENTIAHTQAVTELVTHINSEIYGTFYKEKYLFLYDKETTININKSGEEQE